jgi:DNA-directed RNA polymerase subunit N (RpoN/RPB10)
MIPNKWEDYYWLVDVEYKTPKEALEALHIRHYCSRRMLPTHVDLVEKILPYSRTDPPMTMHCDPL